MIQASTSAEIGRINPLDKEPAPETIVCPRMNFGGIPIERATMREENCLLRLRGSRDCYLKCKAVDHLRKKLNLPTVEELEAQFPALTKPKRVRDYKKEKERARELGTIGSRSGANAKRDYIKTCACGKFYRAVGGRVECSICMVEQEAVFAKTEFAKAAVRERIKDARKYYKKVFKDRHPKDYFDNW